MVCDCCLLYAAIEDDDEKLVLNLMKSVDINKKNCKDFSLLSWAVLLKKVKMVQLLLDHGANPNFRVAEYFPIHHAVCVDSLDILKLLIEYKADIHLETAHGSHSMHLAARYGRIEFLEYLFIQGVHMNVEDKCNATPIFNAITYGRVEAVATCLEYGAKINKIDKYGNSPIHFSVGFKFVAVTKLLIKKGADLNKKNFSGWTPLHLAARYGPLDTVKLLFESGAECQLTGPSPYYSPMHLAADSGNINIIDYFLNKGADVNFQTELGYTLLHAAVRNDRLHLALFLIDCGADVNKTTERKHYSVLDFAALVGNPSTINNLIQNLAKFKIKYNEECRLLQLLSRKSRFYESASDISRYKAAAKIIIKFVALRNRHAPPCFPKKTPFVTELTEFWHQCKRDLEAMDKYYLGDTSISQYKLLQSLFDDTQLAKYLCNEEISILCRDLEAYVKVPPKYDDIKNLIKTGVYRGRIRYILSDRVFHTLTERSLKVLPPEVILKISDYFSIKDMMQIVRSATKSTQKQIES